MKKPLPARKRLVLAGNLSIFFAATATAVATSRTADWRPLTLVVVLTVFAIASDLLPFVATNEELATGENKRWVITSSAPALLAMVLLGPGPALAIGVASLVVAAAREKTPWPHFVSNLANYSAFTVSGGLLARQAAETFHLRPEEPLFALLVLAAYAWTVHVSFIVNASYDALIYGDSVLSQYRALFKSQIGAETPTALLTAATAYAYGTVGLGSLGLLALIQLVFQYLVGDLMLSHQRARELQQHADELAVLHADLSQHVDRIAVLSASRSRLVGQVQEAEERERRRLAEALHDETLQNLFIARKELASEGRDTTAIAQAIAQLRDVIFDLHPSVLEHAGLAAALRAVGDRCIVHRGSKLHVRVAPDAAGFHEGLLFTLGREQLINIAKHADATRVTVTVARQQDLVVLEVHDDGRGIAEGEWQRAAACGHIGLAASVERVEALGGTLVVESRRNHGTCIRTALPVGRAGGTMGASETRGQGSVDKVPVS
jgi:signal transduction histidine kinase